MNYIKILIHCLWNYRDNFKNKHHQMCYDGKKWFCSCGYNNNGVNWYKEVNNGS